MVSPRRWRVHRVAAVGVHAHVRGVGVAEQVVDVAERLLVGADQEDAEPVALATLRTVQRQRAVERFRFDVGVDAAIRIAGQVGDHAAPVRPFVEARDRHDRKHLVDRPDVRDRFEHREIDEVLVDQALVELVEHLAVAFFLAGQAVAHAVRDRVEQVVELGALVQRQLAERVQGLAFGQGLLRLVVELQRRPRAERGMGLAQVLEHRRLAALPTGGTEPSGAALDFGHVDHHHRMVRGHRAAGLGDHHRRRAAVNSAQASASGCTSVCANWSSP